ncbi:hypothetical protein HDV01_001658 [Terramyces sp. JEL0728]|nr:hypothetical protein HDV01_001658 [Terramyces sp. JEL0728]
MILPVSQLVLVPSIMLPDQCLINPTTNLKFIRPSCSGSFYFDPLTQKCEGIASMMVTGFCTTGPTPYFRDIETCQNACVPSRKMDVEKLVPPPGKSWSTWTCADKPCGNNNCIDEWLQVNCFTDPCPQFKCFEAVPHNVLEKL